MKAPPSKSPPEIKPTDLVEKLDAPLTCRAYFIGVSYLARAIACEAALAQGDIEAPPEQGLQILPTYSALCAGYVEALRAVAQERAAGGAQEVQSERQQLKTPKTTKKPMHDHDSEEELFEGRIEISNLERGSSVGLDESTYYRMARCAMDAAGMGIDPR